MAKLIIALIGLTVGAAVWMTYNSGSPDQPTVLNTEEWSQMAKLITALIVLTVSAAVWMTYKSGSPGQPPVLSTEEWWGPNELKGREDNSIRPFQVKFDEEMIKDLKYRLKNHRTLTPPLEDVEFQYGFNTKQLDTWINYWADKYPFAEREKFFNQFPQFKTNIQGLDIHFIRVKPQVSANVKVLPILMLHGWPGSVREFFEAIPLLTRQTEGYDFAFEVIVPSLPGYGFSGASVRAGLGAPQAAVIMRNLMKRLGFKTFYVQGGDWGAVIASSLVTLFPDEVLGHHSNFASIRSRPSSFKLLLGAFFPSFVVESHVADRMYPLSSWFSKIIAESGYFHIQATKPDTVGVGISDSPTGLLAYILEKFSTWTNINNRNLPDGGLVTSGKFTKDQLIDNLMVYWSTNTITTSMRFYAETLAQKNRDLKMDEFQSPVPTWALQAKHELVYQSPSILRIKYPNLIDETVTEDGGHFFAFELPEIFAKDVFKAVKAFQDWHAQKNKTEL